MQDTQFLRALAQNCDYGIGMSASTEVKFHTIETVRIRRGSDVPYSAGLDFGEIHAVGVIDRERDVRPVEMAFCVFKEIRLAGFPGVTSNQIMEVRTRRSISNGSHVTTAKAIIVGGEHSTLGLIEIPVRNAILIQESDQAAGVEGQFTGIVAVVDRNP